MKSNSSSKKKSPHNCPSSDEKTSKKNLNEKLVCCLADSANKLSYISTSIFQYTYRYIPITKKNKKKEEKLNGKS